MRDPTGRSRGFAFLTFEQGESVDKVLGELHVVDGKPVRFSLSPSLLICGLLKPFGGVCLSSEKADFLVLVSFSFFLFSSARTIQIDPKRAIPHDEHRKAAKIFVGGLHASTTIEVLRQFFSSYGQVLDAQVMLDRESARSKGFGFVTFADEEACERALAVGRMEIEGKQVRLLPPFSPSHSQRPCPRPRSLLLPRYVPPCSTFNRSDSWILSALALPQVEVKKAQPRAGRDRDSNHSGGPSNGGHRQSNPNGGLSNSSVPGGGMPNFNGAPGGQQQGMYNPMGMGGQFGGMGYGGGFGMGMNGMGMQAGGVAGGGPVDPNMMARMFSMMKYVPFLPAFLGPRPPHISPSHRPTSPTRPQRPSMD